MGEAGSLELTIYDEELIPRVSSEGAPEFEVRTKSGEDLYLLVEPRENWGARYSLDVRFEASEERTGTGGSVCGAVGAESLALFPPGLIGFLRLTGTKRRKRFG